MSAPRLGCQLSYVLARSSTPCSSVAASQRHWTSARHRSFASGLTARKEEGPWSDPVVGRLNRYIIIAEDYKGPGALARRLEVRDRHLEQAAKGKASGRIEMGGALLSRDFKDIDEERGVTSALAGSILIVQGESIEEVRSRLEQDEYWQAGVFDPTTVKIYPFLRAVSENSVAVGNEAVGELKPVLRRRPRGESTVKHSLNSRKEVYVTDPRASGKTLNTGDRRSSENTLGHLRNTQSRATHKATVTLDSLRKNPSIPPKHDSQ